MKNLYFSSACRGEKFFTEEKCLLVVWKKSYCIISVNCRRPFKRSIPRLKSPGKLSGRSAIWNEIRNLKAIFNELQEIITVASLNNID
jgi:hypothetical protein